VQRFDAGSSQNTIDWVCVSAATVQRQAAFLMSASPSMTGGRSACGRYGNLERLGARTYPDMFALAQAHAPSMAMAHCRCQAAKLVQ
jgi:hypothetical protein